MTFRYRLLFYCSVFFMLITFAVPTLLGQALSFTARRDFIAGIGADSVITADVNGDGKPDLVSANDASNDISVFIGNGNGTFQPAASYPANAAPSDLQAGDFNGDGKIDLVVASLPSGSSTATVSLLVGNGDGTFQSPSTITSGAAVSRGYTIGDFNHDGALDLAIIVPTSQVGVFAVSVLLGNGNGTFQPGVTYSVSNGAFYIGTSDTNGDSNLDLITSGSTSGGTAVSVLLGQGDGTFQAEKLTSGTSGGPIVLADFSQDGIPDLALNNDILLGNGDGTFQPPLLLNTFQDPVLASADFNSDGTPDLVTASGIVLLGLGDGTFQQSEIVVLTSMTQSSITIGDFNQDGKADFASVASALGGPAGLVSVVTGNGNGTFVVPEDVPAVAANTPGAVEFVLAGDFNGDGLSDIATIFDVMNNIGDLTVALNNGSGTFGSAIVTGLKIAFVNSGTAADLNHDGKLDVMVTNGSAIAVLLGKGDGTFQTEVDYGPTTPVAVTTADLNGDGNLDMISADGSSNTVSVWLGNGDGTFGFPSSFSLNNPALSVVTGDFNHDGKLDVAAAAGSSVAVLLGNGAGSLGPAVYYAADTGAAWVATGDLNADGNLDLVTANTTANDVSVLLGNGNGTFGIATQIPALAPGYVTIADVNGDGHADIAVFDGAPFKGVTVLLGNGNGTFQTPDLFGTNSTTPSIAVADFNGDGKVDLATPETPQIKGAAVLFNGVAGPSDFTMTVSSATLTVTAGQSASTTISLGPVGGFSQPVTLTCSGAPVHTACSVSPSVLTPSVIASATVTISTTARPIAALMNSRGGAALCTAIFGSFVGLVFIPAAPLRRFSACRRTRLLALGTLVIFGSVLVSCGGGSSTPPGGSGGTGTPAGTYNLTVTATANGVSHSTAIKLTVN